MKIAILEDHKLFGEMLQDTLKSLFIDCTIELYEKENDFLSNILSYNRKYDFLFLDLQLKNTNSIEMLKNNLTILKYIKNILIVSSFCSPPLVQEAFGLGIKGYLSKNCSKKEIMEAISTIESGEKFVCQTTKSLISRTFLTEEHKFPQLTPREAEVLKLMCQGLTSKEIAFELNLSVNTVQMYVKSLFNKFSINRSTDLVIYAIKHGLNL